jgi:uncharacterized membrane protein YfcA
VGRQIDSLSLSELAACGLILIAAYSLRGSTGFGTTAGMPLLALFVPVKILIPVWTLLGIASSVVVLWREARHVSTGAMIRALPTCLIGTVIGLYLFTAFDSRNLARGLGLSVMVYGAYSLYATARPAGFASPPRTIAPLAGLLAGAVGTLFGTMASIFFAIYLDAKQLTKDQFRATMSAMILLLSIARGAGYFVVDAFDSDTIPILVAAFPMMLLGLFLGNRIHGFLSEVGFRRLISVLLLVTGQTLVLR